jgi:hypothetical protein
MFSALVRSTKLAVRRVDGWDISRRSFLAAIRSYRTNRSHGQITAESDGDAVSVATYVKQRTGMLGAEMRLVCLCVGVLMSASPVFAESFYIGAAAGSDTTISGKSEFGGRTAVNRGGTTPSLAVRAGIGITDRWGVEVELSHDLRLEASEVGGSGALGPTLILSTFSGPPGGPGATAERVFRIDSAQRLTAVNTLAWVGMPLGTRVDLIVGAGISFGRKEFEERYQLDLRLPLGFPRIVSVSPDSVRVIAYEVGPIVGTEARIRVGDRFRVVPGFRLSGSGGTWSVRPTAGLAWTF